MLNEQGYVCEGTGENLFTVRNGILSTPPLSDGLLEGITRDTILHIASDMDLLVIEESLTRSDLYIADEMFMCGSAAELTPVRSVDDREIGPWAPLRRSCRSAISRLPTVRHRNTKSGSLASSRIALSVRFL